jgi:hypothetical protein
MSKVLLKNRPKVPGTTSIISAARSHCEAHFYRWKRPETTEVVLLDAKSAFRGEFSRDNSESPVVVVNNDIVRCTVSKDKSSHAGTFTIVLKAGRVGSDSDEFSNKDLIDYTKTVKPGDWVNIYITKTGGPNDISKDSLKMLGIVEQVTLEEFDNPASGAPTQVFVVSGKDFGKVFESQIFFNPIMNSETAATIFGADFLNDSLKAVSASPTPSPDDVMKALVSFFYGGAFAKSNREHETWFVPPSLAKFFGVDLQSKTKPSFIDIFDYNSRIGLEGANGAIKGKLPGQTVIKSLPTSGTIWQVLSYYSNALLNELYCDLVPTAKGLKPTLIFRQLPYSVAGGNLKISTNVGQDQRTFLHALPKTTINSSMIKRKVVSKVDAERINHVVVIPRIETPFPFGYKSALNPTSVQRYGLRSLAVETAYAANGEDSFEAYCLLCVNLLAEWFFNNEDYYNGSITVEGLDKQVPLGSNLFIEDIGQLYHVEGYTHNFEQMADGRTTFTTSFSVIRGCDITGQALNRLETGISTTVTKSVLENIPSRVRR